MKKQEVLKFLQKIKVYYPSFNISDTTKEEWQRKLEPYDFEDCCMKLDKHLEGDYQNDIPKPYWITKYLKTTEQKQCNHEYHIVCPNCEMVVPVIDLDNHMRRCNATEYVIKEMKKYLNKEVSREQLNSMEENLFWEKYDAMLQIIADKLPKESVKRKLIKAYFGEIDLSKEELGQVVNSYEER